MFSDFSYLLFIVPAIVLYYISPVKFRKYILALSGMAFYLYFARQYFVLLLAEAIAVFWMSKSKRLFIPALALAVFVLGFFKYLGFVTLSTTAVLKLVGVHTSFSPPTFVVPLAISFFTFEFIHYLVDRFQGKIEQGTFAEFLAFIFFFPTMVAGPIKRYQDFVPQINNDLRIDDVREGITRILIGFAKKIFIADTMNIWPLVVTGKSTGLEVWLGVIAYTIKIYADFSAYSDMAIGSAKCFSIIAPENFMFPYFKRNISEFWKSWHISLTRWITDYVFIPMGGSRRELGRVLFNTLVAMGISGLWHGASFHFIVWGLYHGALLCIYRVHAKFVVPRIAWLQRPNRIIGAVSWAATFGAVMFGWMLFVLPVKDIVPALKLMLGVIL